MAERMRYSHSVIDVAVRIHDAVSGSGDGIPEDEVRPTVEWLHWRLNEGWNHQKRIGFYSEAVRLLGLAALDLAYGRNGLLDPSLRPD